MRYTLRASAWILLALSGSVCAGQQDPPVTAQTHLFLVGVGEFPEAQFPEGNKKIDLIVHKSGESPVNVPSQDVIAMESAVAHNSCERLMSGDREMVPTSAAIREGFGRLQTVVLPADRAVIYMTTHGVQDREGNVYLLTADSAIRVDADGYALDTSSAISLRELAELLRGVKAKEVILLLDACHSGAVEQLFTDEQLSKAFSKEGRHLYCICSSGSQEASYLYSERNLSLCTYYLVNGLGGAADGDHDGHVSMDELFAYLARHVKKRSERIIEGAGQAGVQKWQRPARYLGGGGQELPAFSLQPQPFEVGMRRMATCVQDLLEDEKVADKAKVAVFEFSAVQTRSRAEELSSNPLGQVAARRMALMLAENHLQIMEPSVLKGFDIVDKDDVARLAQLNIDFSVTGTFFFQQNPLRIQYDVSVRDLRAGGITIGSLTLQTLYTGEIADLVEGTKTQVDTKPLEVVAASESALPALPGSAAQSAEQSPATAVVPLHPHFKDYTDLPIKVSFERSDPANQVQPISAVPVGEDCCLAVRQGDGLRIRLKNTSNRPHAVLVLLDGMNILTRVGLSQGRLGTPDEHLANATYWIIPAGASCVLDSWYTELKSGSSGSTIDTEARKFVVVNAPDALGRRLSYDTELGDLRIFIYPAIPVLPGTRGPLSQSAVGIGEGAQTITQLTHVAWEVDRDAPLTRLVYKYREEAEVEQIKASQQETTR